MADGENVGIQSVYELLFPDNKDADTEIKSLRESFGATHNTTLFNLTEPAIL
jgi:hypothetical protein